MAQSLDNDANSLMMGGPCPFPEGDARRDAWLALARYARESEALLQAVMLKKAASASPQDVLAMLVDAQIQRFDAVAALGVFAVRDHDSADELGRALAECRDYLLTWFQHQCEKWPQWIRDAPIQAQLKLALDQRVAYWTAEALAKARGSHDQVATPDVIPANVSTKTEEAQTVSPLGRGPARAAIIEPVLKARGLTRARWAQLAGVDTTVVYNYLKGTSTPRADSARAMAEALGLSHEDLPK